MVLRVNTLRTVDRIALYDTGHHVYGTQPIPNTIVNKDSVNMRRVEIGLKGLE
jgi:hypothetical protein